MNIESNTDVIVIGGGPAGTTAAAVLAGYGRRVILLEREPEPPFKIGESLIPGTWWTLHRIGMVKKLEASAFVRKHSVQFYGPTGRASRPFYFSDVDPHESSVTWQVVRSEFDGMLLDNAREKGARVYAGVAVQEIVFDGDRATGVRARLPDGKVISIQARVVVDATGQSALLGRRMNAKMMDPRLKKASVFSHFENARRDEGIDEGATLVLHTRDKDSWFWYIPLHGNKVSVGVVGGLGYLLQGRKGTAQEVFDEEVAKCAPVQQRLREARQLFPVKTRQDFSYKCTTAAGPGWVLVGDAFGFLDPIYSTGVMLAFKSGEMAADTIRQALLDDDLSAATLGSWAPEFLAGMEAFRKLVYAFYDRKFSFSSFLRKHPDCRSGVIDILSGNVYRRDVTYIFGPMAEMLEDVAKS